MKGFGKNLSIFLEVKEFQKPFLSRIYFLISLFLNIILKEGIYENFVDFFFKVKYKEFQKALLQKTQRKELENLKEGVKSINDKRPLIRTIYIKHFFQLVKKILGNS